MEPVVVWMFFMIALVIAGVLFMKCLDLQSALLSRDRSIAVLENDNKALVDERSKDRKCALDASEKLKKIQLILDPDFGKHAP